MFRCKIFPVALWPLAHSMLQSLADGDPNNGVSVWSGGLKNVIFICVFVFLLIGAMIWWLRR